MNISKPGHSILLSALWRPARFKSAKSSVHSSYDKSKGCSQSLGVWKCFRVGANLVKLFCCLFQIQLRTAAGISNPTQSIGFYFSTATKRPPRLSENMTRVAFTALSVSRRALSCKSCTGIASCLKPMAIVLEVLTCFNMS